MSTTPIQLSPEEKLELKKRQKQITTWQQAKRLEAIRLLDLGLPVVKVAQQLCINKEVIYKYTHTFRTSGFDGLLTLSKPGKESKLTDEQIDEIDLYITEERAKGNRYSGEELVDLVKDLFGIEIGAKWLYKRLLLRRQARLDKHLPEITTALLIFQQLSFAPGFRRSLILLFSHGLIFLAQFPLHA